MNLINNATESNYLYLKVANVLTTISKTGNIEHSQLRFPNNFNRRLHQVVLKHFENESFDVETLAEKMGVTRIHLYRNTKKYIGKTPSTLIRTIRLERGRHFLLEGYNVSEAAFKSGFRSVAQFSRSFKKYYQVLPSHFGTR